MKTRLIFVRHAEAEGNLNRVFHGWTDSKLTEKGHVQAEAVAERLKKMDIDVLYSSSLKRTLQTAEYISRVKSLPIIRTDQLKEINGGDWEGEPWVVLPQKWPDEYETWETKPHLHKMPNGESMEEFQKRLIDEVLHIIKNNKGKNICIVTHGTAMRAMQCYFRDCSLKEMLDIMWQDNTAITIIDYEKDRFKVIIEGDSSHLGNELSTVFNQEWWNKYQDSIDKMREDKVKTSNEKPHRRLVKLLFETGAIRVCPENKPFWYTSGTIGPYYINTHFLYGNENKANMLLEVINREKENVMTCPLKILEHVMPNYNDDPVYHEVIDEIFVFIKNNIDIDEVDYISGGERRDWFFSLILSEKFMKPHFTIYKDLTTVVYENGKTIKVNKIPDKNVLHIADLITEASSYQRGWVPAVKKADGCMKWSVVVVDRNQGGSEYLSEQGIKPYSIINVDKNLFNEALFMDIINEEQFDMISDYLKDPKASMKRFLRANPKFIEDSLNSCQKTKERAILCMKKDIYNLGRK